MRVLTLGSGFVADHLPFQKINEHIPLNSDFIDSLLDNYKPDVIINCIGKTGRPNIDWCESNKEITAITNTALPILLAESCAKKSIHLIQIGSGCIYFGESPDAKHHHTPEKMKQAPPGMSIDDWCKIYDYKSDEWTWIDTGWKETDFANPKSFYSKTKYACDLMLGEMPHVTTLRIRMPVSEQDNQRNLINKLRGYDQIIDIPNSMTFMSDLVRCIDWVIKENKTGIFHVANPRPITAARIMNEYQKYVPEHKFSIISESQLDQLTQAKRSNCILNTDKLTQAGFIMTPTEDAITACMAAYIKNMRRNNVK